MGTLIVPRGSFAELRSSNRERRSSRDRRTRRWRHGRFHLRSGQLCCDTLLDHLHNTNLLRLGRLKQSWRAGETERGESLFARDDSSRFCPPVPDEIIESPCKNGRLGSGKETRRLNWLGTLNSVWTISFENKISLPGEKIARPIAVDHEASENRWRFEGRMMKCEGFA